MSANDFARCFRSDTMPDITENARTRKRVPGLLFLCGVSSVILSVALVAVNPAVGLAASAADEPPGRTANLIPSSHEVSRLDGDAEQKLLADLAAAEDLYADRFEPAQFDRDVAAAFRRYGLDLETIDPKVAGERLGDRVSTASIASEIDNWCLVRRTRLEGSDWRRLVEVARVADPDPWRNALRDQYDRLAAAAPPALGKLAADAAALKKQPAETLMVLALLLHEAGDPSTATSVLRAASRRFSSNFRVWLELGNLRVAAAKRDDQAEAARCFARAVALRPRSHVAHTSLGDLLASQGKIDEATAEYLEADRLKKDSNVTLTDLRQFDLALAKAEIDRTRDPLPALDRHDVGQTPTGQDLADVVFDRRRTSVSDEPQSAAGFYNRGIHHAQQKEYDKAIADFGKVIKLDPEFASAHVVRGEIWLMKRDFDHAIADYNEALRLDRASNAYRGRGFAWLGKKQLASAIDDFNEAIRMTPEDASVYYGRGYAWSAKKEVEKAMIDFDEAIRLDPLFSAAYIARGHAWSSQKEFDKAIAEFDDAIRLDPDGASTYTGRGYAWSQKKDFEKAIADYDKAIRLDPDAFDALNGRAWLWSTCPDPKYRDGKKAVETAKKACELTEYAEAMILDTLAAASAETGDFDSAVKWQAKALELLKDEKERSDFRARLELYQQKKPYRQSATD
jgi:tetratricopeptide (TPR) repeat protein